MTPAPSLTEFLLARLAEEQTAAGDRYLDEPLFGHLSTVSPCDCNEDHPQMNYLAVDPARVLADVEAKRAIVEWLTEREQVYVGAPAEFVPGALKASEQETHVLRLLAQPYADHPDFDPGWLT